MLSTAEIAQGAPAGPPPPSAAPALLIEPRGLAEPFWRYLIDHIGELGAAILAAVDHELRGLAQAMWNGAWHSTANIVTQIPPELSYNFGPYRAIAGDSTPLALGGATLALVLLGLRTILSAIVGHDHVITHVLSRVIPSVFLTLAYPELIVRGITW